VLLRLFALFTIVPLIELAGLVWLSGKISLPATLALIVATGLAGAWLLRHQTWQTFRRVQADLGAGRVPADALLDGLLMIVAGVLLISPGFVTDLAALLLLFPPTRRLCKAYLASRLAARVVFTGTPGQRFKAAPGFHAAPGHGFPGSGFPSSGPASFAHDKVIEARVIHTDSPQELC
jgi:UPF0716 protein FxsA